MEYMLARSLAGHDKGEIFVIISQDGTRVVLSDGRLRPVSHPKQKNIKHIQLVKRIPDIPELRADKLDDAAIRRIIREYKRYIKEEGNCECQNPM